MRRLLITCLFALAALRAGANPPHAADSHAQPHAQPHPEQHASPATHEPAGDVITAIPAPAHAAEPTSATAASSATLAASPAPAAPSAQPFYSAHRLKGVRVQSLGDSLRVILVFDQIAPYNLKITPGSRVAELELISTEVGYLAPDLLKLNRNELSGIWLTRANEALSVLELRLPTDKVRIEHFTLPEMGALVLDLYRTDSASARLTQAPLNSSTVAQPGALPLNVMLARGANQASSESTIAAEPPAEPGVDLARVMNPVSPNMLPGDEADATHAQTAETTHSESEPTTGAPAHTAVQPPLTIGVTHLPDPHAEVRSLDKDYDYFPLSAIRVESPLGLEIVEAFQFKDWESVIDKSVRQYFTRNPMGREGICILYMLAEARWRLAQQGGQQFYNLANVYDQALSTNAAGPLGAFAHWRLAQLADQMNDPQGALSHLEEADKSPEPGLRSRIAMLRTKMLEQTRQYPQALAQIDGLIATTQDAWSLAPLLLTKASVLGKQGESTKAWDAYTSATQLDPGWINLDVDAAIRMARLGLETNHLDAARTAVEYVRANFSFQSRPELGVELMLLYARILAAQGESASAEQYFRKYLGATDAAAGSLDAEILKLNPAEVSASKQRFCELLWSQNKFREAMAEFDRTYTQSLRAGIDTDALAPLADKILPSFMQYSVAVDQPGDAAEAWRRFGAMIDSPTVRAQCYEPLAEALTALGLFQQALSTLDQLPQPARDYPSTQLKRAKVLQAMGHPAEALDQTALVLPALQDPLYHAQGQELQAVCYEALDRPLEAAQAWHALASEDSLPGPRRGDALLRSGELFLKAGAPDQAAAVGLKALLREQEAASRHAEAGWGQATGTSLRFVLARAFLAQGDDARAKLVLQDFRARAGAPAETRAEAGVLLGDIERRNGDSTRAAAAYKDVADDTTAPELWRGIARQNAATLQWNEDKPKWAVKF